MLADTLTRETIQVQSCVTDWKEAIQTASIPLLNNSTIQKEYIQAMIDNVIELGPYIVIAPDIAIAHARPDGAVNKVGLSLLKLNQSINFGEDSHYAKLIFVLAAIDNKQHLNILGELTSLLNNQKTIDKLKNSASTNEIINIIKYKEEV